jgi:cytochrome b6
VRKIIDWFETRLGISDILKFAIKKEVPRHSHTIWYYTGSAILVFLGIQIFTGIILAFYYSPTLETANSSVARIMTEIPFGWILRSVHSWSATFMIATVLVHMISIAFVKSYRSPRELTWMTGVILMAVSMGSGFTGYLLPWDDLSLAATKVGTDIPRALPVVGALVTKFLRGGADVSGDTLSRFYIFHVCVMPLTIFGVLGIHLYLVQKLGMSVPVKVEQQGERTPSFPFWPNFVLRESAVWLVLFGILITVAVFLAPDLGPSADLMAPAPEGIKPEWYFLFLFQTLKLFPSQVLFMSGETLAILLMMAAGFCFFLLPVIDNRPAEKKGRIITGLIVAGIVYAVAMSVWSLM